MGDDGGTSRAKDAREYGVERGMRDGEVKPGYNRSDGHLPGPRGKAPLGVVGAGFGGFDGFDDFDNGMAGGRWMDGVAQTSAEDARCGKGGDGGGALSL